MSKDKTYVIPKGTECIAYRRSHDMYGRPSIEKKTHILQRDNKFDDVLVTPQRYIREPHKFPGNSYTVQLVTKGYSIFVSTSRSKNQKFFLAVPDEYVEIKRTDNDQPHEW